MLAEYNDQNYWKTEEDLSSVLNMKKLFCLVVFDVFSKIRCIQPGTYNVLWRIKVNKNFYGLEYLVPIRVIDIPDGGIDLKKSSHHTELSSRDKRKKLAFVENFNATQIAKKWDVTLPRFSNLLTNARRQKILKIYNDHGHLHSIMMKKKYTLYKQLNRHYMMLKFTPMFPQKSLLCHKGMHPLVLVDWIGKQSWRIRVVRDVGERFNTECLASALQSDTPFVEDGIAARYYVWEVEKDRELFKEVTDGEITLCISLVNNPPVKFNRENLIKAADNCERTAQYNLGDVYLHGKLGKEKDEELIRHP
ncbi:hypothetical protein Glove_621g20 [Diversispora epigaea]|uniref:Uncharacterized protein n=1 Tax=Diversispora epigaea TaxID=1348612 RepID=A0A397GA28_9GLOM|nr:hypothetical protein Glove_621g20 [Diversispora epigaea]